MILYDLFHPRRKRIVIFSPNRRERKRQKMQRQEPTVDKSNQIKSKEKKQEKTFYGNLTPQNNKNISLWLFFYEYCRDNSTFNCLLKEKKRVVASPQKLLNGKLKRT